MEDTMDAGVVATTLADRFSSSTGKDLDAKLRFLFPSANMWSITLCFAQPDILISIGSTLQPENRSENEFVWLLTEKSLAARVISNAAPCSTCAPLADDNMLDIKLWGKACNAHQWMAYPLCIGNKCTGVLTIGLALPAQHGWALANISGALQDNMHIQATSIANQLAPLLVHPTPPRLMHIARLLNLARPGDCITYAVGKGLQQLLHLGGGMGDGGAGPSGTTSGGGIGVPGMRRDVDSSSGSMTSGGSTSCNRNHDDDDDDDAHGSAHVVDGVGNTRSNDDSCVRVHVLLTMARHTGWDSGALTDLTRAFTSTTLGVGAWLQQHGGGDESHTAAATQAGQSSARPHDGDGQHGDGQHGDGQHGDGQYRDGQSPTRPSSSWWSWLSEEWVSAGQHHRRGQHHHGETGQHMDVRMDPWTLEFADPMMERVYLRHTHANAIKVLRFLDVLTTCMFWVRLAFQAPFAMYWTHPVYTVFTFAWMSVTTLANMLPVDWYAPIREHVVSVSFLMVTIVIVPYPVTYTLARPAPMLSESDIWSCVFLGLWVVLLCPLYCGLRYTTNLRLLPWVWLAWLLPVHQAMCHIGRLRGQQQHEQCTPEGTPVSGWQWALQVLQAAHRGQGVYASAGWLLGSMCVVCMVPLMLIRLKERRARLVFLRSRAL